MNILLVNGSPHQHGCTYTALCEVEKALHEDGVATSWFHLGKGPIRGCIACDGCKKTNRCVFDDAANTLIEAIIAADGMVLGSPVYYAGPNGALCALMDRVFYAAARRNFSGKIGSAVVSCRRAGASAALDRLNKYFSITRMPIASSQYWNMVHGNTPDEVRQDEEGMQIMRTLGHHMARLVLATSGLPLPVQEASVHTNFIR